MQIWKYTLDIIDLQTIKMPEGANVISLANRAGMICMWAIVDESAKLEARAFEVIRTGSPMDPTVDREYIGTVQTVAFVWHIFFRKNC